MTTSTERTWFGSLNDTLCNCHQTNSLLQLELKPKLKLQLAINLKIPNRKLHFGHTLGQN